MAVDAIIMDEPYRRISLSTLKERNPLSDAAHERVVAEQRRRYEFHFEFVVLAHAGTNRTRGLNRPGSICEDLSS